MPHHFHEGDPTRNGKLFEQDLLYPAGDPRGKHIDKVECAKVPYRQYHDAMRDVIEGRNPHGYNVHSSETYDPPAGWARDIHFRLTQALSLQDWRNVKIFPALGTSADIHHGVDFLVEFTEPETGKKYMVTVDITQRDADLKHQKADVMVTRHGAVASDKFPFVNGREVPEATHETREEEEKNEEKRREAVARVIVEVLAEKMKQSRAKNDALRSDMHKRRPRIIRRQHRHELDPGMPPAELESAA